MISRAGIIALAATVLLAGAFAAVLLPARSRLRDDLRRQLVGRDAAVLHPIVLRQFALRGGATPADALRAALSSADQAGMFAMAVFDGDGVLVQAVPGSLPFPDLQPADYLELTNLRPISRYHAAFSARQRFGPGFAAAEGAPVLEVLLPLHRPGETRFAGIAQYWIDARGLAAELAVAEERVGRQTLVTLAGGAGLVSLVIGVAYWRLRRAQNALAERNARLQRAHAELSLAAKASVLGQITSHLVHGLQGPLAGLRTVVASGENPASPDDWRAAADYTLRLQQLIQHTISILNEQQTQLSYEVSAGEVAEALRERHDAEAKRRGVTLTVTTAGNLPALVTGVRGSLLCLVLGNLIDNALAASSRGSGVAVRFSAEGKRWRVEVRDTGPGIPPEIQSALFRPGRSTKPGGSGLGLAISHLMARHIDADLTLQESGPHGTVFRIELDPSAA